MSGELRRVLTVQDLVHFARLLNLRTVYWETPA